MGKLILAKQKHRFVCLGVCTTRTVSLHDKISAVHFSCFSFIIFTGSAKSSTLPLPHRLGGNERPVTVRERDRDRDGYYSDRNELIRERERDRDRDRGYLSDHNSK